MTGLAAGLSNNIIIADGDGNRRINVGATGNVGIGTNTGNYLLDVAGTGAFYGLRVSSGATSGYVLTSDATGNATWQAPVSSGWSLSGNAGTNPLTQFIGTTDAKDLVFKTFNIETLRLTRSGSLFGVGYNTTATGTNQIILGENAGENMDGQSNTVIGGL